MHLALRNSIYKGIYSIGHGGSDAGYRARFIMLPDQNVMIVVLTNVSDGSPGRLANKVTDTDIVLADYITEPEPSSTEQPAISESCLKRRLLPFQENTTVKSLMLSMKLAAKRGN